MIARIIDDDSYNLFFASIKVGDIVEVTPDQQFPADLLLLHAHTDSQICQITTANLDGETNLKVNSSIDYFRIIFPYQKSIQRR